MAQIEKATFSKKVRRMLGLDLDCWNNILVLFLAMGGIAALVVGIATFNVVRLQKQQAIADSERIEKLRHQNLDLEAAISPRFLEQLNSATALKHFTNTKVFIVSVPDFEARRLTGQLKVMFDLAGWKYETLPLSPGKIDGIKDGVDIQYSSGVLDPAHPTAEELANNSGSKNAAEALVAQLKGSNITATASWVPARMPAQYRGPDVPIDALVVRVGLKPTKYFSDKRLQELENESPGGKVIFGNQ